jgi:hypothetical protein
MTSAARTRSNAAVQREACSLVDINLHGIDVAHQAGIALYA